MNHFCEMSIFLDNVIEHGKLTDEPRGPVAFSWAKFGRFLVCLYVHDDRGPGVGPRGG